MNVTINVKQLRESMPEIVRRVGQGQRFTVLYRSRPAFRIVPVEDRAPGVPLDRDPIYRAGALGRSRDGLTAADHDRILYGTGRR